MLKGADIVLQCLRAEGVERVLVTCGSDNEASRRTIEKNGGIYESTRPPVADDPVEIRRYWIE